MATTADTICQLPRVPFRVPNREGNAMLSPTPFTLSPHDQPQPRRYWVGVVSAVWLWPPGEKAHERSAPVFLLNTVILNA